MSSIVRLTKVIPFHDSRDPTWGYVDTIYWTAIETYISILVPNLPAIRSYLTHLFPNLFGLGMTYAKNYKYERIDPQRTKRKNPRRPKTVGMISPRLWLKEAWKMSWASE